MHDTLVVSSRLDQIAFARRWATKLAREAGFDEEQVWAIELALAEALSNVIRHGYGGAPDEEIRLALDVDADRLVVTVADNAAPFAPAGPATLDVDDPGVGGYGLYLMEKLMDEVIREPTPEDGTVLRLVKRRR